MPTYRPLYVSYFKIRAMAKQAASTKLQTESEAKAENFKL